MRPLHHPDVSQVTLAGILHALADPVRLGIFQALLDAEQPQNCSEFLETTSGTLPKSSLSEHFRVLRESGLVRSERRGVELINTTRMPELKRSFGPMIEAILAGARTERKRRRQSPA